MRFSDYEQLRFERRGNGVLLITLDRPDKYNATDEQMHSELARVWTDVSADPETRVAVITGAGKAFSAGGDLEMVKRIAGNHDRVAHMLHEMSDMVYNVINCEKPIVSAINGVAVGAGTVVALLGQAGTTVRGAYDVLVSMAIILYFLPYLFLFASIIRLQREPAGPEVRRVPGGKPVAITRSAYRSRGPLCARMSPAICSQTN